ncbi:MAG: ribonuclease HII [Metamycoplasmataceae bacterium]
MKRYEEKAYQQNYQLIGGLDEVGRGSIAGPLVCAIVILPKDYNNLEINDSKLLTAQKREVLAQEIMNIAIDYNIQIISSEIVDKINPKRASQQGMLQCLEQIKTKPDYCLVDYEALNTLIPHKSIVKGDQKSLSIAAASIIAKVYRDNLMKELGKKFPNYQFEKNKGYLTKFHREAIQKYGPIKKIHRFSYRPIRKD